MRQLPDGRVRLFHGVWAAHAALRPQVIPLGEAEDDADEPAGAGIPPGPHRYAGHAVLLVEFAVPDAFRGRQVKRAYLKGLVIDPRASVSTRIPTVLRKTVAAVEARMQERNTRGPG